MLRNIAFIVVLGILIFSCEEKSQNIQLETSQVIAIENGSFEHDSIVLDKGEKWLVVPEMMAFIKNIENGVIEFSKKEYATFEDHKKLSKIIDKNLEDLTSNCTMTGQAHDELHKWLLPFLDLASEYAESEYIEDAKASFQKIKQSFKEFNLYFK